jgi:hypothetical protein
MPRTYTPAIKFANSGSAAGKSFQFAQTVEKTTQYPADHNTLQKHLGGVIRFRRDFRLYLTTKPIPSVRLRNDHIGVYEISGRAMASPSTRTLPKRSVETDSDLKKKVLSGSYQYSRGTVTPPPPTLAKTSAGTVISTGTDYNNGYLGAVYGSRHHEVVRYGAFLSGSETIENPPDDAILNAGQYWVKSTSGRLSGSSVPLVPFAAESRNLYYVGKQGMRYFQHNSYYVVDFDKTREYGRTYGVTTSSAQSDFAVYSRITGTLQQRLSLSGTREPTWFLGGHKIPFNSTPYIPASSASLGNGDAVAIDAAAAAEIYKRTVGVQKTIYQANDITAYLNRQGYTRTTEELWIEANMQIAARQAARDAGVETPDGNIGSNSRSYNASLTAVELMPTRTNRAGGSIYNGTDGKLFLQMGSDATVNSFTVALFPGDLFDLPEGWLGSVSAIWAAPASGKAQVIEYF